MKKNICFVLICCILVLFVSCSSLPKKEKLEPTIYFQNDKGTWRLAEKYIENIRGESQEFYRGNSTDSNSFLSYNFSERNFYKGFRITDLEKIKTIKVIFDGYSILYDSVYFYDNFSGYRNGRIIKRIDNSNTQVIDFISLYRGFYFSKAKIEKRGNSLYIVFYDFHFTAETYKEKEKENARLAEKEKEDNERLLVERILMKKYGVNSSSEWHKKKIIELSGNFSEGAILQIQLGANNIEDVDFSGNSIYRYCYTLYKTGTTYVYGQEWPNRDSKCLLFSDILLSYMKDKSSYYRTFVQYIGKTEGLLNGNLIYVNTFRRIDDKDPILKEYYEIQEDEEIIRKNPEKYKYILDE